MASFVPPIPVAAASFSGAYALCVSSSSANIAAVTTRSRRSFMKEKKQWNFDFDRSYRKDVLRKSDQMLAAVLPTVDDMSLPGPLSDMVRSFAAVPDVKLRYQQLLFFAQKLPPMDPALKTDENLVRGCQSVVHIFVSLDDSGCVRLQADSDAQLTKGLVALLVRGFDGASPQQVLDADPAFLSASGLSLALTPARNNGFASALALVKSKVEELANSFDSSISQVDANAGPTFNAILRKLSILEPVDLQVVDESEQHATHAAMRGKSGETHFAIKIVSDKFTSMSLVDRHRAIYKLLDEEMAPGKVHALTIEAKAPVEVVK